MNFGEDNQDLNRTLELTDSKGNLNIRGASDSGDIHPPQTANSSIGYSSFKPPAKTSTSGQVSVLIQTIKTKGKKKIKLKQLKELPAKQVFPGRLMTEHSDLDIEEKKSTSSGLDNFGDIGGTVRKFRDVILGDDFMCGDESPTRKQMSQT